MQILLHRCGHGETKHAFVMMPSEEEAKAVLEAVAAGELAGRGAEWEAVRCLSHKDYERVAAVPSDEGATFDAARSLAGVGAAAQSGANGGERPALPSRKRPRPAAAPEEQRELEEEEDTVLHRAGRTVWRHLVSPLMTMTFGKPPVIERPSEAGEARA